MITGILFTIFAWLFVIAIIVGSIWYIVCAVGLIIHEINSTPLSKKGASGRKDKSGSQGTTYNVRIDITTVDETNNRNHTRDDNKTIHIVDEFFKHSKTEL